MPYPVTGKGAMGDDQASFVRSERDGRATLVVTGEIDLVTAPYLRDELAAVVGGAGSTTVVDLSGVTFIDSSGLGALIDARTAIDATDATLVLLNPSGPCRRVLELTGTAVLFEITDGEPA
jgi:anti-anti-sigma factor